MLITWSLRHFQDLVVATNSTYNIQSIHTAIKKCFAKKNTSFEMFGVSLFETRFNISCCQFQETYPWWLNPRYTTNQRTNQPCWLKLSIIEPLYWIHNTYSTGISNRTWFSLTQPNLINQKCLEPLIVTTSSQKFCTFRSFCGRFSRTSSTACGMPEPGELAGQERSLHWELRWAMVYGF